MIHRRNIFELIAGKEKKMTMINVVAYSDEPVFFVMSVLMRKRWWNIKTLDTLENTLEYKLNIRYKRTMKFPHTFCAFCLSFEFKLPNNPNILYSSSFNLLYTRFSYTYDLTDTRLLHEFAHSYCLSFSQLPRADNYYLFYTLLHPNSHSLLILERNSLPWNWMNILLILKINHSDVLTECFLPF